MTDDRYLSALKILREGCEAWDPSKDSTDPGPYHEAAMRRGALCRECVLFGAQEGPVPSEIRPGARLAIVGQEPGGEEVRLGRPFVGPSGKLLDQSLKKANLSRSEVSVLNVACCRPPNGKKMDELIENIKRRNSINKTEAERDYGKKKAKNQRLVKTPQECCLPRFKKDLIDSDPTVVIPLGNLALIWTAKAYKISTGKKDKSRKPGTSSLQALGTQRGFPFPLDNPELPGKVLVATYHPSYALSKARHYIKAIWTDIEHAVSIANREGKLYFKPADVVLVHGTRKIGQWAIELPDWFEPIESLKTFYIKCLEALQRARTQKSINLTVDIETSGLEPTANIRVIIFHFWADSLEHVLVVPLRWPDGKLYSEKSFKYLYKLCKDFLNLPNGRLIFQNGDNFDMFYLIRDDLIDDPRREIEDTMQLHKHSSECDYRHNLATIAAGRWKQTGDIELWKGDVEHDTKKSTNMTGYEHHMLLVAYAAKDGHVQGRILRSLVREVKKLKSWGPYCTDRSFGPVVREMRALGARHYKPSAHKEAFRYLRLIKDLTHQIRLNSGIKDLNPNSSDQVADYLYGKRGLKPIRRPDGKPWEEGDGYSVGRPALMALQDEGGVPPDVLQFIKLKIMIASAQTIYSNFIKRVWHHDPYPGCPLSTWIRSNWRKDAVTGRMTSSPNLQNIIKSLRKIIVPGPGNIFCQIDLEQVELRIYTDLSGDKVFTEAFLKGLDAHTLNAAMLLYPDDSFDKVLYRYKELKAIKDWPGTNPEYLKDPAKLNKYSEFIKVRNLFKAAMFAMLYGAAADKVYEILAWKTDNLGRRLFPDLRRDQIYKIYKTVKHVHPELDIWHAKVHRELFKHGSITVGGEAAIGTGRRRHALLGAANPNELLNFGVQAKAADLMDKGVLAIAEQFPFKSRRLDGTGGQGIVAQIHDEVIFEVPIEQASRAVTIAEEAMQSTLPSGIKIYGVAELTFEMAGPNFRKQFCGGES